MKIEKPDVLKQIRDIIEKEYGKPPFISGKCWEARATEQISELIEPLIEQAKAEAAREIFDKIENRCLKKSPGCSYEYCFSNTRYQSLKNEYTEGK